MYYLRVFFENSIKDVKIKKGKEYSFGSGHNEDILFRDFPKNMSPIKFTVYDNYWQVTSAKKNVALYKMINTNLEFNKVYIVHELFELAFAIYKLDDKDTIVCKVNKTEIIIGSDKACDVSIRDKYVAKKQLKLLRYGDQWYFEDLESANGTYVNGKKHTHLMLIDSDEIVVGFASINIRQNILTVKYEGNVLINLPNLEREKTVNSLNDDYPYYYKPHTRLKEDVPEDEVEIEKAPRIGNPPKISWLSVLLPPIAMAAVMVLVCVITNMNTTMLLMTIPMLMIGAVVSIFRYNEEVKNFALKQKKRTKVYEKYLDEQIGHMHKLANMQRKALNLDNPSTKYCMESVEAVSGIWDRNLKDDDFMTLRVGSGSVKASYKINVPKNSLELEEDEYMKELLQVAKECRYVNNVPITIDLKKHASVGIIGNKIKRDALTKNLIYQATAHHNYDDLKLIFICDKEEEQNYNFVKWLPHIFDDQRNIRFFANDMNSSSNVLDKLFEVIETREEIKSTDDEVVRPYYLVVSVSKKLTLNHAIARKLTQVSERINIGTIFSYEKINDLPNDCYYICDVSSTPIMYEKDHASVKFNFNIDVVDNNDYEKYGRMMLPIITDTENKAIGFPKSITFMEGLKAHNFEGLHVNKNWEEATPERSMSVPIGKKNDGEDFYFDIHEKAMGPHGLVAGMTGSGKSEAVQTFILSLACKFPPESVSFVIVDFKGTGLILPFKNMPHLAGTISDIDTNISRNLIALMTELERRKELLDKYKVSNISSYLKLYREGKATEPLSYLFIVIDEFAEFKKKFPDFMKAVSSIFRIGRTLGVHIILLTQKPANVVDDEMNANTRFRWCLKVASSSDSNDMLHHPDAAKITNPGRAYIQVGEDEVYEQVQTYYSGANFNEAIGLSSLNLDIAIVDEYGKRIVYKENITGENKTKESEINYVVRNLEDLTKNNNYRFARKVWSEKLPTMISINEVDNPRFNGETYGDTKNINYEPVIGMLDDPRQQVQLPLKLEFTENGSYTLYGAPGTGKTTFLNTLIYSTAQNYTPDEVNMYILDFGGGSLNVYSKLPHVGGVVLPEDEEKLIMLQRMISAEFDKRKKLFANAGLTNIKAYKSANPNERLPYILLMIDNYAYAVQNYPDLPDFLMSYIRDGANYGMYFINAVSTVSSMNFRLAENIKNKISLYMTEKADYNSIFAMSPGISIDNIKGHGICKYGKYCVEYQTALPIATEDENERVIKIRDIVKKLDEIWKGKKAKEIPILPEKVDYKTIETKNILLGLSKNDVENVEVNVSEKPFILISNYRNDAFSDMLYEQINEKYKIKTKLLYGEFKKHESDYVYDKEKFLKDLDAVIEELDNRKKALKDEENLAESKYPYILIYIKSYSDFLSESDENVRDILDNIITLGKRLNIIVVAQEASNKMSSNVKNDKFIVKMLDTGTLVVVGGNISDNHNFVNINISFAEKNAQILLNEAYVIVKTNIGESEYKYIRTCTK